MLPLLDHGDSDIDAQVPGVGKEEGRVCVEDEAVAVEDGRVDALVDRPRRGLPYQPLRGTTQLQSEEGNQPKVI